MTVSIEFGKSLQASETSIPGLLVIELPVHGDSRGWFKENWQRQKMTAEGVGLPDFGPVQNNVSFNDAVGTTRGIHAEPWDKYVSVAAGRIFGAWVDLREGPSFGAVYTTELDPSRAIFVPRGVGNSYQTLEPDTSYTYLVNDHWSADATYSFLNLADETASIAWPIPLEEAELSEKDRLHPRLADVVPIAPRKTLVIGANGQLGRALRRTLGGAVEFADRASLDLGSPDLDSARTWRDYDVIVNAAAFTSVDAAETQDGRVGAWQANARGVAAIARVATEHGITLVHVSSDYVFDGTKGSAYTEDDPVAPMGVYGQTKAAGDLVVATVPRHYIVRTSWVIGEGNNFVRTMVSLAGRGIDPAVVDDQVGRLTFTQDLADAIIHLLSSRPAFGTYNVTGDGTPASWAQVAAEVFRLAGHAPERVRPVSTDEYFRDSSSAVAPRPRNSVLELSKIAETGFVPTAWETRLSDYVGGER